MKDHYKITIVPLPEIVFETWPPVAGVWRVTLDVTLKNIVR
jgi:hypothetical protein